MRFPRYVADLLQGLDNASDVVVNEGIVDQAEARVHFARTCFPSGDHTAVEHAQVVGVVPVRWRAVEVAHYDEVVPSSASELFQAVYFAHVAAG